MEDLTGFYSVAPERKSSVLKTLCKLKQGGVDNGRSAEEIGIVQGDWGAGLYSARENPHTGGHH